MKKGIDISEWQGNLTYDNFKSIKESGIEFIIIRCGYTGYGKSKSKNKDKYFENNYNLAKQLNIPVGTYYYSCATTDIEAIEEASFILELIKDKTFEYPICIDTEDNHDINNNNYSNESQYSIGKDRLTNIIKNICKTVEKENKYVVIYASTSWFRNNLNLNELKDIDKWIAQWSNTVTFEEGYGIWQYSSRGSINGINGNVDMNYSYKEYPNIMKSLGLNGFIKKDIIEPDIPSETPEPVIPEPAPTPDIPVSEIPEEIPIIPEEPVEKPIEEEKTGFFSNIFEAIKNFFKKFLNLFK